MSTELRRDLRPISTDYNILSIVPEKGSYQDGWDDRADQAFERLNNLPYKFSNKHDALIFGDNMKNLILWLLTREHVPLDGVRVHLRGNDDSGYSIWFDPKYYTF